MKITEVLALYAALLSTIVFIWNIRRAIPRFTVEIVFGTDKIDGKYVSGAYISVKNQSPQVVHLSNISILYPYKRIGLFELITHVLKYRRLPLSVGWVHSSLDNYEISDGCPISIESGKSHGILVPESILETIFKECQRRAIRAVVQDQLWRIRYSHIFKYPDIKKGKS